MPDFDPTTQNLIGSLAGTPLKPGVALPPQNTIARIFDQLGIYDIEFGTVAPGDVKVLWFDTDTRTVKRRNPISGSWAVMTPDQFVLHLLQRGFTAAVVESLADNADKMPFFDVSANESKMISVADFKSSLGVTGWTQYGSTQTLGVATTQIEFELPTAFTSVLLHGTWQATGAGTLQAPDLLAVYPTDAEVNLNSDQVSTIEGGTARRARAWLEGDRSDLTGVVRFNTHRSLSGAAETTSDSGTRAPIFHLTNRIAKLRYRRPSGTWQFAIGSEFKLFVR